VSGANPTCGSAIDIINSEAAAVRDAVSQCAAQSPGNTCSTVIAQVAQALTNTGGLALTCSGISADDSCPPLEETGKLIVPMIGDTDVSAGPVDVMNDSTNGDVLIGTSDFAMAGMPLSAITPPQLPGTDNLTTTVGLDTFDTPADALAAGDLNAVATAKTYKGGCDEASNSNTKPDYVYQPFPVDDSNKDITLHYNNVSYQINFARTRIDSSGVVEATWQVNACMYGGARTYNHYRLWLSSGGMTAFYSPDKAYQLDYGYASGTDDSLNTDSLDFNLDFGDLKISPHIGQSKTGKNTGSAFAPPPYYDQKSDGLYKLSQDNEVQGWWREYHPWYVPPSNAGSTDYQSSTLSGLFEFGKVTEDNPWWYGAVYSHKYCTYTRGCK